MKKYYIKSIKGNHYLKESSPGHIIMVDSLKDATKFDQNETDDILRTWNDCYKRIEVKN